MSISRKLGLGFAALLLASMIVVVGATPWDGVPDDPAPAQAIWVDPKTTTCLNTGDTFVVDILVNVTDPDGAGPLLGLFGFQYKFYWNSSVLQAVEIQTHSDNIPSGDRLPGWSMVFVAQNETGSGSHNYSVSAIGGSPFTGVDSLCTYTFQVLWQPTEPNPDWCGLLDIQDDILADDAADPIDHTTVDGHACIPVPDNTPPTINDPSRTPSGDVQPDQAVSISVNVTDGGTGVKNVTLSYTTDDGESWTDMEMTYNSTSKIANATIPGQPAFTTVKFNITAYDNAENRATRDGADIHFVYSVVPEFPVALILPLFMIAALIAVIIGKTVWSGKRRRPFVTKRFREHVFHRHA
jgi:hypothetical protein